MALLEARGLSVQFGGHLAVDNVSLEVDSGTIVGLIGPNGAGKTTFFNALAGAQACTGSVFIDGVNVSNAPMHKRAALGLNRTFQRLEVFGSMTALDNVRTAVEIAAHSRWRAARDALRAAQEIIERTGLEPVADRRADTLPTGQARLLELGRALATRPRILLLDEPASGLDQHETARLAELLTTLARDGIGVLLVEHDMDFVMEICSRISVLNFGALIASGTPAHVRSDPAVQAAYLGSTV
jgi:branched-chain amino acid transport system ATP-binding protein